MAQPLHCARFLLRPHHPSDRYTKLDATRNPKRNLNPSRLFRNETPSNSTRKYAYKRQNPSVSLYVLAQRPKEGRVGRDIMQHTCQDHGGDFCQFQRPTPDYLSCTLERQ